MIEADFATCKCPYFKAVNEDKQRCISVQGQIGVVD
jgi:hypothetical protein